MILCKLGGAFEAWFMIDSGADVNVVSENEWELLEELFRKGDVGLFDYKKAPCRGIRAFATQKPLTLVASFSAWVEISRAAKPKCFTKFLVIKGGEKSLLGRFTAKAMRVLQLGESVNAINQGEEGEVERFPVIPGEKVTFDIDPLVPPSKNVYYHIPAAFSERAAQRLKKMVAQGIIEEVLKAPRWISGMSAVPKGPSDFRLVVNMKGPNKAIRRCFYRLPQLVEIQRKLNGARFFSKLDLTSAFHHVELEESSRELTTFLAEDGMYRFTRLVFGVNCAPEMFQQIMERILRGTKGTIIFIDDVLIFAEAEEELRARTGIVVNRLKANNLTLNLKKCEFDKEQVMFLGHQLSAAGMNIDEMKVKAVRAFREPRTATELRSFLGLASYVSSFIPSFGTLTHELWKAATAKPFVCSPQAQESFERTKEAIVNTTVTNGYFSDTDEVVLYTDASPVALGAVLVQIDAEGRERVISFASKSLTETEQRYPQTQREALGIVWAIEHYHYHLRGRHFTVKTDARGIAFIFQRERDVPKRIMSRAQGFALRLNEFSFDIEYIKGTHNIADSPSRLYKGRDGAFQEMKGPWEIGAIDGSAQQLEVQDQTLTLKELREETLKDDVLQKVILAIGAEMWSDEIKVFQSVREELYASEGLLKAGSVVVPESLRQKALRIAHIGHPGSSAMRSILRERVWWIRMDRAAEEYVQRCESCTLVSKKNPPVPMMRTILPEATWDLLAADFSGPYARHGGVYIMLIVDCYSRYVLASVVPTTDFAAVRKVLDTVFTRYGYPKIFKADNGPPFQGAAYAQYLEERGVEKVHSTPLFPQQNGTAERYMQLLNKAVQVSDLEGTDFAAAVADTVRAHNSAKHRVTGVPPEELMFNRKVRRGLPLMGTTTTTHADAAIRERDTSEKEEAKAREDERRGAKDIRIEVGDTVVIMRNARAKGDSRFDPTTRWEVTARNRGDLELQAPDGRVTKRNVTMVKRLVQPESPELPVVDEEVQVQQTAPDLQAETRRSTRLRKPPAHWDMYVRMLSGETFH